ncbi:hypothetical protein [Actinomyces ruminicola]|uniref:hypothetical protein n=1 Tax=Actinomyces ruminicola TaxID=332524 RepID=UPI00164F38DB|nr:hypothetical protein [Actinomyces ruminicola]
MQNFTKVDPGALISAGFNKALILQQPRAQANIARLRRVHPDKTPQELISYINKWYLGTVTASGTGAGTAAVVPNGVAQASAAGLDLVTYLEASVFYILCLAEIHDLDLEDLERRKMLVTAVLLGNSASSKLLDKVIGRTAPYWGKKLVEALPMEAVKQANKILGPRFVTKWGAKTGILVLGKQVPLMIGAAIGGGGNLLFGSFVIKAGYTILGPAPETWAEPPHDDASQSSTPADIIIEPEFSETQGNDLLT